MHRYIKFEIYNKRTLGVININEKKNEYGYHMKNTWNIFNIIVVYAHSTKMHICIKFEVSTTNISGVIDITLMTEQI